MLFRSVSQSRYIQIIELQHTMQINSGSIDVMNARLNTLARTLTSDNDPTNFQTELQNILNHQYDCAEALSRNEANASSCL